MKKFTAKDVGDMIDFHSMPHGDHPYTWSSGATCNDAFCEAAMESIAESLSMDGTEVDDSREIYHVQMNINETRGWEKTYWSRQLGATFDVAMRALADARKSHPGVAYRIHADE